MKGLRTAVVGAGPVGMYLALRLARRGMDVRVFDKRTDIRLHSRSIGIHPPAFARLEAMGLGPALLAKARVVSGGVVFWNGRPLGRVGLDRVPGRLLTIPQHETERVLQDALEAEAPGHLHLGHHVDRLEPLLEAFDVVVGCDGHHSMVRTQAGLGWVGGSYDIPYVMGDFPESTDLGDDAAIMLGQKGLVESFPLPGSLRRWVVRLPVRTPEETPTAAFLADVIAERVPFRVDASACSMISAFGVERWEARPMALAACAVFLAGDAAHVISPIGGQGMNLGWFDADALCELLCAGAGKPPAPGAVSDWARSRRRVFRAAARRAEFNMWMGGGAGPAGAAARRLLIRAALLPGLRDQFLRRFTMYGLEGGASGGGLEGGASGGGLEGG